MPSNKTISRRAFAAKCKILEKNAQAIEPFKVVNHSNAKDIERLLNECEMLHEELRGFSLNAAQQSILRRIIKPASSEKRSELKSQLNTLNNVNDRVERLMQAVRVAAELYFKRIPSNHTALLRSRVAS